MNHLAVSTSAAIATGFIGITCLWFQRDAEAARKADDDLVEVIKINPTIVVDLPYATKKNFTKMKLYKEERCFLRRNVAMRLDQIQKDLAPKGIGLKIWDGYRPHRVQYIMWKASPSPGFVGNPDRGSRHNRGAAVDVTLVDLKTGKELEMATPFDEFSARAHAYYEKLPAKVIENRKILQAAMRNRGFQVMRTEWWHFDAVDWRDYPLADIPLEELAKLNAE